VTNVVETPKTIIERLEVELAELRTENTQLREALETRVVIEQAKGVLSERFCLVPEQAFDALRRAARHESRKLQDLAYEVLGAMRTPVAVAREIERRYDGSVE
jgi:AmiR/NasT family two-component response regulator